MIETILMRIKEKNVMHYKFLATFLNHVDNTFLTFANRYLKQYIEATHISLDVLVDAYLTIVADTAKEQIYFKKNGKYRLSSLQEANTLVYENHEYMQKYMHGLAVSQFFWPQHKAIFSYFGSILPHQHGKKYLEIGPGHGLFFLEALLVNQFEKYMALDISRTSLDLTQHIVEANGIKNVHIRYEYANIFNFQSSECFDFIVMCEVLEHLEDPKMILEKIFSLLAVEGKAFLTTCVNCPMMDHLYLYRSIDEIEAMLHAVGFKIVEKIVVPSAHLSLEMAMEYKASIMYGALVEKGI